MDHLTLPPERSLLERIADRATNIGERVVFMVTGRIVELND